MRKIMILLFLVVFSLVAGCTAARKPAPAPDPKPLVVPETSKVGFSPVDLNKVPDVVKIIAEDLAKREAATWLQVNGTNYLLVSVGEKATGKRVEITDVIQKIPARDFVWLDVRAKYVAAKEGNQSGPVSVVSLNLPNQTVNGVGFEITGAGAGTPTPASPTPTPTPSPAKTPAAATPAPAPTPAPTTPTPKPSPTATPKPSESAPTPKDQTTTPATERETKP